MKWGWKLTTVGEREDLSRVREWDGAFTRGVECCEQEDEKCNDTEMGSAIARNEEGETSS
jgi:hypothetical protein